MKRILCIAALAASVIFGACGGRGNTASASSAVRTSEMKDPNIVSYSVGKDGVRHLRYKPQNVCSVMIDIDVKDGVIRKVVFTGGCPGNSQGVASLVAGMKIDDAIAKLEGIDCAGRGTSCPDQLTKALKLLK